MKKEKGIIQKGDPARRATPPVVVIFLDCAFFLVNC
jgi:hypothetical protein